MSGRRHGVHSIGTSTREYARGVTGGLLFSLPLLYTMELWWAGFLASPMRLLAGAAGTMVLLLGYNRFAGIRHDTTYEEIAIDSVEEMGIGIACAAAILWVLGRLSFEMPAREIVGRIMVAGFAGAIGVSVGTAQLGGSAANDQGLGAGRAADPLGHVILAGCGAVILAANVAPTEEIQVLAAEMSALQLTLLALLSMLLVVVILHFSEFKGTVPSGGTGPMAIARSSVVTYAVALVASAALLWFFGRFQGEPPGFVAAQTIVLGFAASLGASAGRLLLQS